MERDSVLELKKPENFVKEDSIVLIDFKAAGSQLSHRQRATKKMFEEGAVRFKAHGVS